MVKVLGFGLLVVSIFLPVPVVATAEPHTVLYSDPLLPRERIGASIFANVACTVLNVSDRPIEGTIEILEDFHGTIRVIIGATFVDVQPLVVTGAGGSWNRGHAFCRVTFKGKPDDVRANFRADDPSSPGVPVIGPVPLR